MSRCSWALITPTLGTRCFKEEGHIHDANRATHVGRGLEPDLLSSSLRNPGEIRWLVGDPREEMTKRTDEWGWEIKLEAPFNWEDIPEVSDG